MLRKELIKWKKKGFLVSNLCDMKAVHVKTILVVFALLKRKKVVSIRVKSKCILPKTVFFSISLYWAALPCLHAVKLASY